MIELREGYKITELGEIPKNWSVNLLDNIFMINTHNIDPQKYNETLRYFSLPAFDENKQPIIEKSLNIKSNKTLISDNSILVSKLNPRISRVWKVNITDADYKNVSSTEFINYVPKKGVDINYFYQYFKSDIFQEELLNRESGSTGSRKRVTPKDTLSIKIPTPPLIEQQKIADILSTVDMQIEQTEQLIKQTKDLKHGLMQQLLTKGIGHTEFKQSELGEIPLEWDVIALKELGDFTKGKGIAKKDLCEFGNACILYGQLYTTYEEVIENVYYFTQVEPSKAVVGMINDLLIPSSGETAIDIARGAALMVDNILVGGDINIFRPNTLIDSRFISYQLNSSRKKDLATLAQGSSVYHLYAPNLLNFKILLAPYEEQKKIAEILSTIDSQIVIYEQEKEKYHELKKGLMQQLLTGKVRVKVDE
ncbi:restriction endonuclease subunit S [Rummeliibacillus pycnus]|uniref:restriction endonuclease subunit S n=1 Tax=Rummeliibacillus pycnus TaxID=101070 RepID=UPI000C9C7250|nr:restriction endonuclease subunit S [Rummeliibacillus pycnus]